MSLARAGDLSIRALTDDARDVELLAGWLSDPRVLEWYEGRDRPFDVARVREHYGPQAQAAEGVRGCIAVEAGEPVGYLQYYPLTGLAHEYGLDATTDLTAVWGVDLFVGDPSRWGSGIGTAMLTLLVDRLFVTEGAVRVVIDPRVANERAVRSYEKVGFRRERVLPEHEVHEGQAWDCWLMVLDAVEHPVGLTARLAAIDSVNPGLVPGAAGESEIAGAVAAWCAERGLEVHRSEVAPGRHNVVAVRRGSGGGRSLLFNAHLDTVGATSSESMRVRLGDGRLEGRGALDTKGGLAAALLAAASVAPGELAGDVIVAAVADEEHGSIGTDALVAAWRADAAVVLEPTSMAVVAAHRGFAVGEVTLTGRPAHTSRPERGANAVHAAAQVALAVVELDGRWAAGSSDPVRRPATLVSRIESRGETFTVPAHCSMTVEVRTVSATVDAPDGPDEQVAAVVGAVLGAVGDLAGIDVEVHVSMSRPPMAHDADAPLVAAAAAAVGRATHRSPDVGSAPYWTDAALHAASGTPAVVLGPTGEGLHEDLEWVTTESLHQLAAALTDLARTWCSEPR